jgi:hypothetical protein
LIVSTGEDEMGRACGAHGEVRGAYNILVGRPDGRRPLGRPRRRWEDNIKMDHGSTCPNHLILIDLIKSTMSSCPIIKPISLFLFSNSFGSIYVVSDTK